MEVEVRRKEVKSLNSDLKDEEVVVRGHVQGVYAVSKKMACVVVRDFRYTVRCVLKMKINNNKKKEAAKVSEKMAKYFNCLKRHRHRESIVDVQGFVFLPSKLIKGTSQQVNILVRKIICVHDAYPPFLLVDLDHPVFRPPQPKKVKIFVHDSTMVENENWTFLEERTCKETRFLPKEIWLEILSMLPFKSILICRAVCKQWKAIVAFIMNKSAPLPLCGLIINSEVYVCLETKEIAHIPSTFVNEQVTIGSGYGRGLLSNLSFDLTALYKLNPSNPNRQGHFYHFHGGLLLVALDDGTLEVHNPANKQVFVLPKSPFVLMHGAISPWEKKGVIIRLHSTLDTACNFIVVKFCTRIKIFEVYRSWEAKWTPIYTSSYATDRHYCWRMNNCVALYEGQSLFLFFLTNKDHGIAIKLLDPKEEMFDYVFPLPKQLHGKYETTRLWECDGSLHISCYDSSGLWLWKQRYFGSTEVDKWEWVLQLAISNTLELSTLHLRKTVAQKYLVQALNAGHRVMPLTCHPDVAVVFILVNSTIYAYNLIDDTVEKITDINEQTCENQALVFPFKPCLSSLDVAKHGK